MVWEAILRAILETPMIEDGRVEKESIVAGSGLGRVNGDNPGNRRKSGEAEGGERSSVSTQGGSCGNNA